jgi:hypothetical protein
MRICLLELDGESLQLARKSKRRRRACVCGFCAEAVPVIANRTEKIAVKTRSLIRI